MAWAFGTDPKIAGLSSPRVETFYCFDNPNALSFSQVTVTQSKSTRRWNLRETIVE